MIIISPYSKTLRDNIRNPKNYPYWEELIPLIDHQHIVQVGLSNEVQLVDDFRPNLSLTDLSKLVTECDTWISVDSFFQHFCWDLGKPGIVIWGQSDPNIFGHPENINLLKDRSYLLKKQFFFWHETEYRYDCFVKPQVVADALNSIIK